VNFEKKLHVKIQSCW